MPSVLSLNIFFAMSNLVPVYFDQGAYDAALKAYNRRKQARKEAKEKGWGPPCVIYPPNKADYFVNVVHPSRWGKTMTVRAFEEINPK